MEENTNTGVETTQQETVKTYTQEEVNALLQSESDKRVSQALATQKKKFEREISLSKLDADERAKVEANDTIAELQQQIAQLQAERQKSELKTALTARGLPADFADILATGESVEDAQANIEALDKLFKSAVKAEVEKRLVGNAPKGNGNGTTGITKADVKKMSVKELAQLRQTNPELYNNLYN